MICAVSTDSRSIALAELLRSPGVRETLTPLGPQGAGRPIESVALISAPAQLDDARAGALVVAVGPEWADGRGYALDVALRVAAERAIAAIVLVTAEPQLAPTSVALAERAGIAVLGAPPSTDVARLLIAIEHELHGSAEAALRRALAAQREIDAARDPAALVEATGGALDTAIERLDRPESERDAAVLVDGEPHGYLCAREPLGVPEEAVRLTLPLAAAALGRMLTAARRAEEAPITSRAELLTELLASEEAHAAPLLRQARRAGVPVDGWHVAVRFETEDAAFGTDDELAALERRRRIARLAIETARAAQHPGGGTWFRARDGSALLLIHMGRRDDPGAPALAAEVAELAVARLVGELPDLALRCGVGGVNHGFSGLRTSAAEARAAVAAARAGGRTNAVVRFDAVGLRRMLIDWYASKTTREAIDSLLAPLDELGERRAETAVQTLQAYLDHQGSLARAAKELHLHRNAVAYRIKRIFEQLDVDPADPEQRLILQLACRARSFR